MATIAATHSPKVRTDLTVDFLQPAVPDDDVTSAYRAGAVAARQGAYSFSCPYIDDLANAVKYSAWMDGYNSIGSTRNEFR